MAVPVVTIDGPSGSGKGTISQWLAERLGWHLLDSGALYRLTALAGRKAGADLINAAVMSRIAEQLDIAFRLVPGEEGVRTLLEGGDVSLQLRTEDCGRAASIVAAIPEVRTALLHRQRAFRQPPGLVADGRDMGTVVFPDAEVKIFLTASAEARAQRRYKQLNEKGIGASLPDLLRDILQRDQRDQERAVSPLKPAEDAVILDTTGMSVGEVCDRVYAEFQARLRRD
ncbi:MAG TPA: (d)CMP kinase [Gammaproteobacteria bacterium]|nr:(d)CMP kinase [Gammaproteobacteria bacterium]